MGEAGADFCLLGTFPLTSSLFISPSASTVNLAALSYIPKACWLRMEW